MKKKVLSKILLTSLVGLAGLTGCVSPNSEIYLFTTPIYPTDLTKREREVMREQEYKRQKSELNERYGKTHFPGEPMEYEARGTMNIFTIRFP